MYRKLKAARIFTGRQMLEGDKVLVLRNNGEVEEIIDASLAGDDIETFDGIICPGFVNAHCHIELSHLKNTIAPQTGLVEFVRQVMANRNADTGIKEAAMEAAEAELHNSGTVAVADICNTADSLDLKKKSKLSWKNFIEVSGFVDATAMKRLEAVESIERLFPGSTVTPHSPYSVSKTMFQLLNAKTENSIVSIHNQENEGENALYEKKTGRFLQLYENLGIDISGFRATGKTSLQSWLPYFTKDQSFIAVHNSFTKKEDIDFVAQYAAPAFYYCICINANLYIEDHLPPLRELVENNCDIVLGTDSYASNWNLSIMEEIKTVMKHFPGLPIEQILQWATYNGAKALGIEKEFGSFEKGKRPGLVLIDQACKASRRIV